MRRNLPLLVLLTMSLLSTGTVAHAVTSTPERPVSIELSDLRVGRSWMSVGVTHTQYSVDPWGDTDAISSARSLLASTPFTQNQHLMGWGTENPNPAPGVYDWRSLDRRVQLMLDTTATPVITLAGAPDWMKGGRAGTTDWTKLEVAPTREFYDDFARLSALAAARYPEVKYFQVWNELKGFYDPVTNRWDAASYTDLYNAVYDAVKAVRPDALIGGPYVVMDSWASPSAGGFPSALKGSWGVLDQRPLDVITHWLKHKRGADFIAIDGGSSTRDRGLITDPFTAAQKFAVVTSWVRTQTSLPIVWSEWYPRMTTTDTGHQAAVLANALAVTARAGAGAVLLWQPQCVAPAEHGCLFTDTRQSDGGSPTRLWDVSAAFTQAFPPGTPLVRAAASSPGVTVMSSPWAVMLVNTTASTLRISGVAGVSELQPFEVRFARR